MSNNQLRDALTANPQLCECCGRESEANDEFTDMFRQDGLLAPNQIATALSLVLIRGMLIKLCSECSRVMLPHIHPTDVGRYFVVRLPIGCVLVELN